MLHDALILHAQANQSRTPVQSNTISDKLKDVKGIFRDALGILIIVQKKPGRFSMISSKAKLDQVVVSSGDDSLLPHTLRVTDELIWSPLNNSAGFRKLCANSH